MHFIGIMEDQAHLGIMEAFFAMPLGAPHPGQRLLLNSSMLNVAAPLQLPPWISIFGEDCAEHVHEHAGIVVLVYMLVAARRSSCAAVRRSSYAAVRRSSCSAVRRSSCSAVRRSSCAAVRRSSRPVR